MINLKVSGQSERYRQTRVNIELKWLHGMKLRAARKIQHRNIPMSFKILVSAPKYLNRSLGGRGGSISDPMQA
jgi:hypothetical protein